MARGKIPEIPMVGMLKDQLELVITMSVVALVIMMIVPLPSWMLDFLLIVNVGIAIIVLLLSMYTKEVLEFAVFPSMLLVLTLFRLALNVSSTRLILLLGDKFDGKVIRAFGDFVVGGNYLVGIIVFLILVLIQFIVITKGAGRVAEVHARFTLDALPGKQMAIDADLNAGLITSEEAQERRSNIRRETDFFGAMDGASKFVQGDAIAGIVITIINIIGGIVIGVIQQDMSVGQAASTFTILTVGDGLSSQIPALLISTATGILITRSASENSLGSELGDQILTEPKILWMAAGMLTFLAFFSGLPPFPLIALSGILGTMAFFLGQEAREVALQAAGAAQPGGQVPGGAGGGGGAAAEPKKAESMSALLKVEALELEIGYGLIPLFDVHQGGDLLDRITMIRRQIAIDLGLILPPMRIRDNVMQVSSNSYVIKIKGLEASSGEIYVERFLAMDPGNIAEKVTGIETIEPAFGLPAIWIDEGQRLRAESAGYTVVDPPSVLATHLSEVLRKSAHQILGREEVVELIDNIRETHPTLVSEQEKYLTIGLVQKVLERLLKEGVSIRNMPTVLETLIDASAVTKNPDELTEYVRQALGGHICRRHVSGQGFIPVITLDPSVEEVIAGSLQNTDQGVYCTLDPTTAQKIFRSLRNVMENVEKKGFQAVVLCSPVIRIHFKNLTERVAPALAVISYNEVTPDVELQTVGMVSI
ncbi:MAG: flagellar biosynthesis protein FlhA [Candidatus Wallbacteria bacterium HGW-Wallbacteria-1]|jgi:flagellar biosynthesis protein FlhA|uniref:Flagellar biosynthesis protein FlhA n=1 Tax=Candidatus Wallbacteria bacterium HGW-Wallbacteria-1 TaxID=2013854 RepID=A0A2N1PSP9_9BACT|nr:MAG: flagellar biosynthesis protein FlhA [Candidatus Wallbacteria bacterium HGW-Wallbacteria-1]